MGREFLSTICGGGYNTGRVEGGREDGGRFGGEGSVLAVGCGEGLRMIGTDEAAWYELRLRSGGA